MTNQIPLTLFSRCRFLTQGQVRARLIITLGILGLCTAGCIRSEPLSGSAQPNQTAPPASAVSQPAPIPPPPKATPAPMLEPEARMLLSELGYWVKTQGPAKSDDSLRHALIAFQKVEGQKPTGRLKEAAGMLRTAAPPAPRQTGFPHVEVDLSRQVLLMVDLGGVPLRILPVSTGSGKWYVEKGKRQRAVTPTGEFQVERKIRGKRRSELGLLFDPCYIHRGIAIHGNPSVPTKPASHGCIRIPMFASRDFAEMTKIGTPVLIY